MNFLSALKKSILGQFFHKLFLGLCCKNNYIFAVAVLEFLFKADRHRLKRDLVSF